MAAARDSNADWMGMAAVRRLVPLATRPSTRCRFEISRTLTQSMLELSAAAMASSRFAEGGQMQHAVTKRNSAEMDLSVAIPLDSAMCASDRQSGVPFCWRARLPSIILHACDMVNRSRRITAIGCRSFADVSHRAALPAQCDQRELPFGIEGRVRMIRAAGSPPPGSGEPGWDRTIDLLIKSQMLCR